jgi:hypothetical protein
MPGTVPHRPPFCILLLIAEVADLVDVDGLHVAADRPAGPAAARAAVGGVVGPARDRPVDPEVRAVEDSASGRLTDVAREKGANLAVERRTAES